MRAQSIHDVVILFPGALGDLLLALPALRALRIRHRTARFTAVVSEPLRALVTLAGVADATASLDGAETTWLFGGARCPAWLAARPLVYSALGAGDRALRARLETVVGGVHWFGVERGPGRLHALRAYARALGVEAEACAGAAARIHPPHSAPASALWDTLRGPMLAMHPGAGARAKRWAAAGFAAVARWWRAAGGAVVAIAGPAELHDPPIVDAHLVRAWALPDLAAVLARATLYLGNDSGVSHLAGAVGVRGVVLFGPTEPRRWRPIGHGLTVLRARRSGPSGIALGALPVRRVVAACRRLVAGQLTIGDLEISVPSVGDDQRPQDDASPRAPDGPSDVGRSGRGRGAGARLRARDRGCDEPR